MACTEFGCRSLGFNWRSYKYSQACFFKHTDLHTDYGRIKFRSPCLENMFQDGYCTFKKRPKAVGELIFTKKKLLHHAAVSNISHDGGAKDGEFEISLRLSPRLVGVKPVAGGGIGRWRLPVFLFADFGDDYQDACGTLGPRSAAIRLGTSPNDVLRTPLNAKRYGHKLCEKNY